MYTLSVLLLIPWASVSMYVAALCAKNMLFGFGDVGFLVNVGFCQKVPKSIFSTEMDF